MASVTSPSRVTAGTPTVADTGWAKASGPASETSKAPAATTQLTNVLCFITDTKSSGLKTGDHRRGSHAEMREEVLRKGLSYEAKAGARTGRAVRAINCGRLKVSGGQRTVRG